MKMLAKYKRVLANNGKSNLQKKFLMKKSMAICVYKDCGANQINQMNMSQNVFHGLQIQVT